MAQMQQLHELDDARAARAAAGARRVAARRHGPALAGRPARRRTCSNAFPQTAVGASACASAATSRCRSARCAALLDQLGDIDELENLLRNATQPGQLAEVDLDQARELLGDDAARSLDQLARAREGCSRKPASSSSAKVAWSSRRRASARIGQQGARRPVPQAAAGPRRPSRDRARRASATSAPTSTSPTSSATRSTSTSSRRSRTRSRRQGAGTPVRLTPDDFEIERTEQLTRTRHRADARRVAVDADARQLPRRRRRSRWRCTRSSRRSSRATTSAW